MAQKKNDNSSYEALRKEISEGKLGKLYIFHGAEHYLMNSTLSRIRKILVGDGLSDFNYHRFEGKGLSVRELYEAVDALPAFSDRTLIEIHDYDLFKCGEEPRSELIQLFSDLPDYICIVFVYTTIDFAPDKRLKDTKSLLKNTEIVEFCQQEQSRLTKWIQAHFASEGKKIDNQTAEYLSFITGGLMSSLVNEISKIVAYSSEELITREYIDAVVIPVVDAAAFKLSNALTDGKFGDAAKILDDLFRMRESAHKIFYYVSMTMRQLFIARLCIENNKGISELMDICGIRLDFQARNLMQNAKKLTTEMCRNACLLCAESAKAMNNGNNPEEVLTELLPVLAFKRKADSV